MIHIDLHTHSCYSGDGEIPPARLVEMANRRGISHLSVADHNRAIGVREAIAAAENTPVTIIPAIELDCAYKDVCLHVLGYFIDHMDPAYDALWSETRKRGLELNIRKIESALALGYKMDPEEVMKAAVDGVLSDVAVAEAVLSDPRNLSHPDLLPYRPGGEKSRDPMVRFAWDVMSRGGPAYVPDGSPSLAAGLDLILSTGGTPVLAHPGANLTGREHYLPDIVRAGVLGVEAYCNYHSPEQVRFWRQAAIDNNAIFTCGSDYHGKAKPSIDMGRHGAEGLEEQILNSILDLKRRRSRRIAASMA